jgi:hypothetical protein
MFSVLLALFISLSVVSANFSDFFNNNFGGQEKQEGVVKSPLDYENAMLNARCDKYLCTDTGLCVDAPKFCPCPYPSSQLRCFLPDGKYLCISKPAGEISSKYNDPATNWKVDAKDDDVRDCGWVARAWRGTV